MTERQIENLFILGSAITCVGIVIGLIVLVSGPTLGAGLAVALLMSGAFVQGAAALMRPRR